MEEYKIVFITLSIFIVIVIVVFYIKYKKNSNKIKEYGGIITDINENVNLNTGNIKNLNSEFSNIVDGKINKLESQEGNIKKLNSIDGSFTNINSSKGNIQEFSSNNSNFKTITTNDINTNNINVDNIYNRDRTKIIVDRYFEVDMRNLDNSGNFVYSDENFYPLLIRIDRNKVKMDDYILNFTISGHCANNYKVDDINEGLYKKNGTYNISPYIYTILSGMFISNNWGGSQPYAEVSLSRKNGMYSKCFGNICYPITDTGGSNMSGIYKGKIPESIGKLRNIDTLRIKGEKVSSNGHTYLCVYIRGARRYVIKTNATSVTLLENGGDIIYLDNPSNSFIEPLNASSRYNVLKINENKSDLFDPFINDITYNKIPIYNRNIDLTNPNQFPGTSIINNFLNKNTGKYIYSNDNLDLYVGDISIKSLNDKVNRLLMHNNLS